jgi:hypothetical protein
VPNHSTRGTLGVVSPCSSCKNQRAFPDPNGQKNFCPRRNWIATQQALQQSSQKSDQAAAQTLRHLTLTGTEGTNLVNPVYDPEGSSILVWIAMVEDNDAQINDNGQLTNPSIVLGPDSFDTNQIVCNVLPFTPEQSTTEYRANGGLKEWDTALVTIGTQQPSDDGFTFVHNGGTVKRASFLFGSSQPPVPDHEAPET